MLKNAMLGMIALFALTFGACKNDQAASSAQAESVAAKPDTLPVYTPVSREGSQVFKLSSGVVYWSGRKETGGTHTGSIQVSEGQLLVNKGQLAGGKLTIDMRSLAVTDLKDAGEKADLESHLKDSDFFEVNKFPSATFDIGEVLPSRDPNFNAIVHGDLTIKGVSKPVNIPAKLRIEGNTLTAVSLTFPINRTDWGINFHSTVLGTAKDKLIQDVVTVSLEIKAEAVGGF